MKRFLFGLLAFLMLLPPLAGCGTGETVTETETESVTLDDDAAVAAYLRKLRGGAYAADKLFDYDDLSRYFVLGDYKGLLYPDDDMLREEATDEEVEAYLVVALMNGAITDEDYTRLTEGTVERYDVAHIVYEGVIDGEKMDGASTGEAGADLVIGSGNYIKGFESGLIGKAIGSTVTLDLQFSPYYGDEAVAGKAVRFTVTVEYVQRPKIPELTAELVNEVYSTSFADMESVWAVLKEQLDEKRSSQAQSALADYLQDKALAAGEIKGYPEREMQYYREHFQAYIQQYADSQEMGLEEFLTAQGFTMEEFEEQKEEYAATSCQMDLLVFSIARAEGIEATDEQISALILGLLENNEDFTSAQEMIEYYISVYGPYYFENRIISASVIDLVKKAALKENAS